MNMQNIFIHLSVDKHLICCQLLVIMNKPAMNIFVKVFLDIDFHSSLLCVWVDKSLTLEDAAQMFSVVDVPHNTPMSCVICFPTCGTTRVLKM